MLRLLAMALVDKQQVALPDSTLGEVSAFQQIWSSVTQLEILVLDWAADKPFEPAINATNLEPFYKPVDSSDAGNTCSSRASCAALAAARIPLAWLRVGWLNEKSGLPKNSAGRLI